METDLRWFGVVYMGYGANMAGRRNKNAFEYVLQVLILSQTQLLGIKNVVCGGLEVVWGGLEVVWGGLGCFHGPPKVWVKGDWSNKCISSYPSIYLLILPTPSRAFLAGTARQGYEKE